MKIRIKLRDNEIEALLDNSDTARKVFDALPLKGAISRWGDEIYFEIPIHIELEKDAREAVEIGDLGFWPSGDCFCIFFGKTPASSGDKPKAASAVNVFGKIIGDSAVLKQAKDGQDILIEKA